MKSKMMSFEKSQREKYRKDNLRRLCEEDFNTRMPYALEYIRHCFQPSQQWNACYNLKQAMTSRIGYCFQTDMARYMEMCGYEVKMNKENLWLVKAEYRIVDLPEINFEAKRLPWRE